MATKKKNEEELVVAQQDSLALPSDLADFADEGQAADKNDVSIPFVVLLDKMSAACDEIEGAKAGYFLNKATNEVYENLVVLPVYKVEYFVEWEGDDGKGTFVRRWDKTDPDLLRMIRDNDNNSIGLKNGDNQVVETHTVFCLVLDSEVKEVVDMVAIPFSKTRIKPRTKWFGAMNLTKLTGTPWEGFARCKPPKKVPYFVYPTLMESTNQVNNGHTSKTFKFSPYGGKKYSEVMLDPKNADHLEILKTAKEFKHTVESGERDVDFTKVENNDGADEDVPF